MHSFAIHLYYVDDTKVGEWATHCKAELLFRGNRSDRNLMKFNKGKCKSCTWSGITPCASTGWGMTGVPVEKNLTAGKQCTLYGKEGQQWGQRSDPSPLYDTCETPPGAISVKSWAPQCKTAKRGPLKVRARASFALRKGWDSRICAAWRREGSGVTSLLAATVWLEDTERPEPNSSQRCTVTGQEATDTSRTMGNSD